MTEHIRHIQRGGEVDFNPDPKNRFVRSTLREFHHHEHRSGLSVKTVTQGEEHYRVGGKWHVLRPGYFLLVNQGQEIECEFREPEPVEGLCLYLDDHMVHDILHTMCSSEEHLLLNRLNTGTATGGFWERLYPIGQSLLGDFLENLSRKHVAGRLPDADFYHRLGERLVLSQQEVVAQAMKLPSARKSTRMELWKRVTIARDYLEANYARKVQLADLARVATLSEYHLIRTFKRAYGKSPYQYLRQVRLVKAARLLAAGTASVSDVALRVGFNDVPTFSKAFRAHHGWSPSQHGNHRKT